MDTFMDKFAHKMTAQEIIRANSEADAEELNRLQKQVEEYDRCLEQQKRMNEELQGLIQGLRQELQKMDEKSAENLQGRDEAIVNLEETLNGLFRQSDEHVHKENVKVYRNVQAVVVDETARQTEKLNAGIGEAVEAAMKESVNRFAGRLRAILGISIAALVTVLAGVVFQVLTYLELI